MSKNLMTAHNEWANRPKDERFETLDALHANVNARRLECVDDRVSLRGAEFDATLGRPVLNAYGRKLTFTHWALTQMLGKLSIPKDFLGLLSPPAADVVLNDRLGRALEEGDIDSPQRMLMRKQDAVNSTVRALHSTRYERLWDSAVTKMLIEFLPPGWRNPLAFKDGIWGERLVPSGLYAGDRDMFAFFIDGGDWKDQPGSFDVDGEAFHNGFFVWNSEVGAKSFGYSTFKFRVVCGNNIVWGAEQQHTRRARHIGNAGRTLRHLRDYLTILNRQDNDEFSTAVREARTDIFLKPTRSATDDVDALHKKLKGKFTMDTLTLARLLAVNEADRERRPNDGSRWYWLQGLTAAARSAVNADVRADIEAKASDILLAVR